MGDNDTHDDNNDSEPLSNVLPAIQVVGLAAVVGVAIADLIIDESEVPWIVYGLIGSIVVGVGWDDLRRFIRGDKRG